MRNLIKTLNYKTIDQKENIVILGAGSSVKNNLKKIIEWKNNHNAYMIGCNYHNIVSEYTSIYSPVFFVRDSIKVGGIIIISHKIKKMHIKKRQIKKVVRAAITRKYSIKTLPPFDKYPLDMIDNNQKILIDPRSAGLLGILSSFYFSPKQVLITGFDGFSRRNGEIFVDHFSGKFRYFRGDDKRELKKKLIVSEERWRNAIGMAIMFLVRKGIKVSMFLNEPIWGIDKNILRDKGVCFL